MQVERTLVLMTLDYKTHCVILSLKKGHCNPLSYISIFPSPLFCLQQQTYYMVEYIVLCVKTTYTTKTWSRLPKRSRGKPGNCKVQHFSLSKDLLHQYHWVLRWSHHFCLCFQRHWGEIHNMGANQEGARAIKTQSKAKENHYKLYNR